jgi:hypothetical protein
MNFKSIKKQLENEAYFQYWKKAIGLSFKDFSILLWNDEDKTLYKLKEGKKDIGTAYAINLNKDFVVTGYNYELNNEAARLNRLKQIAW